MRLAITPGEPAGIGPDLVLLLQHTKTIQWVVVADIKMLEQRAALLKIPVTLREFNPNNAFDPTILDVYPISCPDTVIAGQLNPLNATYVLKTLTQAVELCQNQICQALVTAPVHKGIINEAGFEFTGHTEFLAELTNSYPVMMLACEKLRVALATTHIPLQKVSSTITKNLLEKVITILYNDLTQKFNISHPKITICGLNPHAGENGHLGEEERQIIIPTIEKLNHYNLIGPLPADTAFLPKNIKTTDAFLAMYHDQGLPVLKYACFGQAINITLGLPIIRTSVDHGTALDLAGKGGINTGSMLQAVGYAMKLIL